jgi:hypothetical protein
LDLLLLASMPLSLSMLLQVFLQLLALLLLASLQHDVLAVAFSSFAHAGKVF